MSDEPKKTRGLTTEQWANVRAAYEAGSPVAVLSREYGVRRHSIADRAKRESWTVQPAVQVDAQAVQRQAQAKVIDIATKRAVEKIEQSGGINEQAAAIEELLRMQAPLYAKAAKLIETTLDKAIQGKLHFGVTQGETTAVTDLLNALSKFSKDTRTGAGLRDGSPTVMSEPSGRIGKVYEVVVQDIAESA